MVVVPSPGSIWDYPYLNQVISMMDLVYGTRPKPKQDLFPPNIRIPEVHVTSPLHPLSPFRHFTAFNCGLPSIMIYANHRSHLSNFFANSSPVFLSNHAIFPFVIRPILSGREKISCFSFPAGFLLLAWKWKTRGKKFVFSSCWFPSRVKTGNSRKKFVFCSCWFPSRVETGNSR